MRSTGETTKQMHARQFREACQKLQRAYNTGEGAAIVKLSIEIHSLKGHVPRSMFNLIPSGALPEVIHIG